MNKIVVIVILGMVLISVIAIYYIQNIDKENKLIDCKEELILGDQINKYAKDNGIVIDYEKGTLTNKKNKICGGKLDGTNF